MHLISGFLNQAHPCLQKVAEASTIQLREQEGQHQWGPGPSLVGISNSDSSEIKLPGNLGHQPEFSKKSLFMTPPIESKSLRVEPSAVAQSKVGGKYSRLRRKLSGESFWLGESLRYHGGRN